MNECAEEGQCENGQCINNDGGFSCECSEGYQETRDGRVCNGNFQPPFFILNIIFVHSLTTRQYETKCIYWKQCWQKYTMTKSQC